MQDLDEQMSVAVSEAMCKWIRSRMFSCVEQKQNQNEYSQGAARRLRLEVTLAPSLLQKHLETFKSLSALCLIRLTACRVWL